MDPALIDKSQSFTHGDAWKYFSKAMAGKQYGAEETRDAWAWFLTGWLAKARHRQDLLRN